VRQDDRPGLAGAGGRRAQLDMAVRHLVALLGVAGHAIERVSR